MDRFKKWAKKEYPKHPAFTGMPWNDEDEGFYGGIKAAWQESAKQKDKEVAELKEDLRLFLDQKEAEIEAAHVYGARQEREKVVADLRKMASKDRRTWLFLHLSFNRYLDGVPLPIKRLPPS